MEYNAYVQGNALTYWDEIVMTMSVKTSNYQTAQAHNHASSTVAITSLSLTLPVDICYLPYSLSCTSARASIKRIETNVIHTSSWNQQKHQTKVTTRPKRHLHKVNCLLFRIFSVGFANTCVHDELGTTLNYPIYSHRDYSASTTDCFIFKEVKRKPWTLKRRSFVITINASKQYFAFQNQTSRYPDIEKSLATTLRCNVSSRTTLRPFFAHFNSAVKLRA